MWFFLEQNLITCIGWTVYILQMVIETDESELIIVMDVCNKYHVGPWGKSSKSHMCINIEYEP